MDVPPGEPAPKQPLFTDRWGRLVVPGNPTWKKPFQPASGPGTDRPEGLVANKSAVVVGATGATGSHLVPELLRRGWSVTCVGRRAYELKPQDEPTPEMRARLRNVVVPELSDEALDRYTEASDWRGHEVAFNCLGTMSQPDLSADEILKVERDMSRAFFRRARAGGTAQATLISSVWAGSMMQAPVWFHPALFVRVAREKERTALSLVFRRTTLFRPAYVHRERDPSEPELLTPLSKFLKRFGPGVPASTLAYAMCEDAERRAGLYRPYDETGEIPPTPRDNIVIIAGDGIIDLLANGRM